MSYLIRSLAQFCADLDLWSFTLKLHGRILPSNEHSASTPVDGYFHCTFAFGPEQRRTAEGHDEQAVSDFIRLWEQPNKVSRRSNQPWVYVFRRSGFTLTAYFPGAQRGATASAFRVWYGRQDFDIHLDLAALGLDDPYVQVTPGELYAYNTTRWNVNGIPRLSSRFSTVQLIQYPNGHEIIFSTGR